MSIMILEQGLYAFLLAQPAITNLTTTKGIFLNSVPQGAPDTCLSIQKISAAPDSTNNGPSGLNIRRYQFCTYSSSYIKSVTLQETLRTVIDGFVGYFPNGQRIFNIIRDNELDSFNELTDKERTITDYFIHFAERSA
jgi:hypothetical protein